jgi:hypothetical protein
VSDIVTFESLLREVGEANLKRHLLLGNGFSRACRDDVFAYDALFDRADFGNLSQSARRAFAALGTTDFEVVMRALRQAAALAAIYSAELPELADQMNRDAVGLRDLLAHTIASSHPDRPSDISTQQYESCRGFLYHFHSIYTLNYDLLLYWALMQQELTPAISFDDGFRQPDDGPEDYVTWDVQKTGTQTIHYLHGALHIFDAGAEVQKYTWCNTQVALIDQIRRALAENRFPLFVAEGNQNEKLDRIQHSGLLNRAYRSFASITGALFIFGHSLAENDEHILKLIDRGKVSRVCIGIYGTSDNAANQRIIERANLFQVRRAEHRQRFPVQVDFFDAASARVWG